MLIEDNELRALCTKWQYILCQIMSKLFAFNGQKFNIIHILNTNYII